VLAAVLLRGPERALAELAWPRPDYEPLEGACFEPSSEEERVIALLVDTVVPSAATDPDGVPGALDCCALNLIYDAFFPFQDYLGLIIPALKALAEQDFGRAFVDCDLEQRTEVLRQAEETVPIIRLAYRFIRSTFYGAAYTMRGTEYMGWPGPNLGYLDHPELSFREALADELTDDGNLP